MLNATDMFRLLEQLFDNGDIEDVRSYSGRAMFGERCLAVVTEESEFKLALALAQAAGQSGLEPLDVPEPRSDSMGRSAIVLYWPNLKWDEETMRELGDD